MNHEKNIVLIGLMGAGKTSIGKKVAKVMGYQFIDTDEYIEKITGKKITEIFKKEGEIRFRSEETLALKRLLGVSKHVIATGGGIVVKEENRELIRKLGFVILLDADPEVIYERVRGNKKRPLLQGQDIKNKITTLKNNRDGIYHELADMVVNTGEKNFDNVVIAICNQIKTKKNS